MQQGYFDSGLEGSAALTDSTSPKSAPHYGEEETILAYMTHDMLRYMQLKIRTCMHQCSRVK